MKTIHQIQTPPFKRVILNQSFKVDKSNKFTLMGRWEGARTSCASELSCSWMLPLPLLSPEACAKLNYWEEVHESQGKKHDLQGTGYLHAEKCSFFWLVKPQCHHYVNLFQYLWHSMKMTLQKNKSHSSLLESSFRQNKIILFEKTSLGAVQETKSNPQIILSIFPRKKLHI